MERGRQYTNDTSFGDRKCYGSERTSERSRQLGRSGRTQAYLLSLLLLNVGCDIPEPTCVEDSLGTVCSTDASVTFLDREHVAALPRVSLASEDRQWSVGGNELSGEAFASVVDAIGIACDSHDAGFAVPTPRRPSAFGVGRGCAWLVRWPGRCSGGVSQTARRVASGPLSDSSIRPTPPPGHLDHRGTRYGLDPGSGTRTGVQHLASCCRSPLRRVACRPRKGQSLPGTGAGRRWASSVDLPNRAVHPWDLGRESDTGRTWDRSVSGAARQPWAGTLPA